ncbi:MAG: hypothetical protein U1E77_14840 [Inhella sp.]
MRLDDWLERQRSVAVGSGFEARGSMDRLELFVADLPTAIDLARSLWLLAQTEGPAEPLMHLALAPARPGEAREPLTQRTVALAECGPAGQWCLDEQDCAQHDALLSLPLSELTPTGLRLYTPSAGLAHRLDPPDLLPVLAVLPLRRSAGLRSFDVVGELFADALINQLAPSSQLRVVSRRSTRELPPEQESAVLDTLGATHVLRGRFSVGLSRSLHLELELLDCTRGQTLWQTHCDGHVDDLIHGDVDLVGQCANEIRHGLQHSGMDAVQSEDWASLQDFERLVCAATLIHRLHISAFQRSHELLRQLIERHPRSSLSWTWLGLWHNRQVLEGLAAIDQGQAEALAALDQALELNPRNDLALAAKAQTLTALQRRPELALECCEQALQINPNQALAWLFRGLSESVLDHGDRAAQATLTAQCLSPLDPWSHMFDLATAAALCTAGRYAEALSYCERSIRLAPSHVPTWQVLTIIQQCLGRGDEARRSAAQLLRLRPTFTVQRYREVTHAADFPAMERNARRLAEAGLPIQ